VKARIYFCLASLLAHSIAFAGQAHVRTWVDHPKDWSKAPVSCLGNLSDSQEAFLGRIREEVKEGESPKDIADSIYRNGSLLPPGQRDLAIGLSMATAMEEARKVRPFLLENRGALAILKRRGASVKSDELDLHHFDFDHPLSPQEKEALRMIYPENAALIPRIDDPNRTTPVFLGHWVVLPKENLRSNGQFRTLTIDEYQNELAQKLRDFSLAMDDYIKKDNISNSASSRFFNWSRSNDRATLEASNRVSVLISELVNDYGIPGSYAKKIRADFSAALLQSNTNIAAGIKKMEASVATAAAIVGVTAIVIAVPELWPVGAKAFTLLTTTAPGVSALSSGTFSLVGSTGKMIVSSAISARAGQGSFICNLGNQMFEHGPATIANTLASAGIGLFAGTVVSHGIRTARYFGVTESALRQVARGSIMASPLPMFLGAHGAHQEADYYRQLASEARKLGDEKLARQYDTEVAQREAKAGWKIVQGSVTPIWATRVSGYFLDSPLRAEGSGLSTAAGADIVDPYNDVNVPSMPHTPNFPDPDRQAAKAYRLP